MHNLFVSCICLANEKNSVVVTHDKNVKVIKYYEAEYDYTIGSSKHPTEGTLYPFQLIVIFQEGSLCNGFPFGDRFKVKIKPPKQSGPGGNWRCNSHPASPILEVPKWESVQRTTRTRKEKKKMTLKKKQTKSQTARFINK